MSERRFPVERLAEVLGVQLGIIGGHLAAQPSAGMSALTMRTGFSISTVKRARARGGFRWDQADVAAVRCGLHPAEVWREEWIDAACELVAAEEFVGPLRPVVLHGGVGFTLAVAS